MHAFSATDSIYCSCEYTHFVGLLVLCHHRTEAILIEMLQPIPKESVSMFIIVFLFVPLKSVYCVIEIKHLELTELSFQNKL